jgi:hypothetical protein
VPADSSTLDPQAPRRSDAAVAKRMRRFPMSDLQLNERGTQLQ